MYCRGTEKSQTRLSPQEAHSIYEQIASDFSHIFLGGLLQKMMHLKTQLKCLYTSTHSMGNKQEIVETVVKLESNVIVVTK